MARLSSLISGNSDDQRESLKESLITLIEMIDENILSEEEISALEDTIEFIVEEFDEQECEGCGEMFAVEELDPETGLCEACSKKDDLVESVKKRKKKMCPPGKKRVGGKCVKKTMQEIKKQKKYYKINKKKIAKANAKWRKINKSYLDKQD